MKRIVFFLLLLLSLFTCCKTNSSDKSRPRRNKNSGSTVEMESAVQELASNKSVEDLRLFAFKVDTATNVTDTIIIALDSISFNSLRSCIVDVSKEEDKSMFDRFLPFLLLGLIIMLFVIFFVDKIKRGKWEDGLEDDVVRIDKNINRLKKWRDESDARQGKQNTISNDKSFDRKIDDLQRRIAALEDSNEKPEEHSHSVDSNPVLEVKSGLSNGSGFLYADFIDEGYFSKVKENPDDDTNFELHLNNERSASFIIYPPAYPRIVRNPAGFLQGCEKQVLGSTTISITDDGSAIKDDNGKWRIANKIKVVIK